ncbi:MAG TPA: D-glycero-beta-D-manno-heptose-7-phosphate kinase [Bryobacteraceae bacterium]|nr:D-glycero-beta-D-manno-heptose-7-phosphate kinase [Bryobacteraceae bacterium]
MAARGADRLPLMVEHFHHATVCSVGDIMLDRFVCGSVSRISPEAPVPVLRIERQQSMLGGAGNAVRNLHALTCGVRFFAVTGDDPAAGEIAAILGGLARCVWHLERDAGRQTTVKTRYIADGQQVMRADAESTHPTPAAMVDAVFRHYQAALEECDVVLLSDYAKGLLSGEYAQRFIQAARAAGKPVVVDPKGRDFRRYNGATVIKPNLKELSEATGLPAATAAAREEAAHRLLAETDTGHLLITCGSDGMLLASRSGSMRQFPALAREVFDVSGAGDTVAAVLAAALGSGAQIEEAAEVANLAAGIVVGKRGTAVVTPPEIVHEIQHRSVITAGEKVLRTEELLERASEWERRGYRIGFTNGCFDLLHPGHLSLLETARAKCDRLVVGLNSDASAARLKGPGRPVQDEVARALVLASLRCVDAVVLYDEDTPLEIIRRLRPGLLVKGRDYQAHEVVGADLLPAWNGELLLVDLVPGHSTARTVARMTNAAGNGLEGPPEPDTILR